MAWTRLASLVVALTLIAAPAPGDEGADVERRSGDVDYDFEGDEIVGLPPPDATYLPGDDALGSLCFDNGGAKALSSDDVLWAARMIHGETGGSPSVADAEAMLWAMAQRIYWSPTYRKGTFTRLLVAYSQPINSRWTRTGKHCSRYYDGSTDEAPPDNCSESRVNRRAAYRGLAWENIDETARVETLYFATGRTGTPIPGAVGWFAKGTWERRERRGTNAGDNMVFHSEIERNVFFSSSRPDTQGWTGDEVWTAPPGATCE